MLITESRQAELERKAFEYRKESVAVSTKRSRGIQWNCYLSVCKKFGWNPLPCTVNQACMYVTYLADKMKLSSITTYYQAVVFMHTCKGLDPVTLANPVLKATIKGIGNIEGNVEVGKDPIRPEDIMALCKVVNRSSELEMLVFAAILFLFRTLLRISHIVQSNHTAMREDVKFNSKGFLVRVKTAKNLKSSGKNWYIPVLSSTNDVVCPVKWLSSLVQGCPRAPREYLFSTEKIPVLTYSCFARQFKELVKRAGLKGDFASHSLRRGGASYMSSRGCSIDEVKDRGGWKSGCVYKYICPPVSQRIRVDKKFV